MIETIQQAAEQLGSSPEVWLVIPLAALFGVFVGAIPGLTATMAMALLVPVTYWLEPVPALAAIVTMVACAIFAGDIPTTLLRIPGTPASAAYADLAFGFTKRGVPEQALSLALLSSVVGGLFGAIVLVVIGRQLARLAVLFSVSEYFWLYLIGLSSAVIVSRGNWIKALLATLLGLLISTVGLSAVHAEARFTFGIPELYQGIGFIPAMIGLFGFSEVLKNLSTINQVKTSDNRSETDLNAKAISRSTDNITPPRHRIGRRIGPALRSGGIGTVIGMLPGAGADIGSWVSLAASRRFGRESEGEERDLNELSDATTANSAALAGAWVPALVFGIPGDSVTAIAIGVLLMKNVSPGPSIFDDQGPLVLNLYLIFILANIVLLPIGWLAIKTGKQVVRIPKAVLLPIILLCCVVGAFAISGSRFDIGVMIGMGVLGYTLEYFRIPLGPVVLGIILGGSLEERFLQTLTGSSSSLIGFVDRPVAALLALCWILMVLIPLGIGIKEQMRRSTTTEA